MSGATEPKLTRKERRALRREEASRIMPPEGVPLMLPVAGVGVRLTAQITDILITGAFAVSFMVLLSISGSTRFSTLMGLGALLFFLIRIPYYVLSELAWNGQTLGKRLMKIKVVSHTGGPLTTHALVLRNMMKEAEVFLPGTLVFTLDHESPFASTLSFLWIILALSIPLMNAHRMRLGDMLAGTHVVHLPHPILLSDLARQPVEREQSHEQAFSFLPHQLDHYGSFELQTLESFLRAQDRERGQSAKQQDKETLGAIVERIRKKIGYADAVEPNEHLTFLRSFYNAQRGHLEQRQLFGDRRGDKHYGNDEKRTHN